MGPLLNLVKVWEVRIIKRLNKEVSQVLIQWENIDDMDAMLEDFQDIVDSYPRFNLEDKVVLNRKGNVTCVKKEGELVPSAVRKSGHIVDLGERKIKTSTKEGSPGVCSFCLVSPELFFPSEP